MQQVQDSVLQPNHRQRRNYTVDYKLRLVRLCIGTDVSMAAVAQANDINANLLRRWVREFEQDQLRATPMPSGCVVKTEAVAREAAHSKPVSGSQPAFLPLRFETGAANRQTTNHAVASGPVDVQVRRGDLVVQIQTKQARLADCANLLAVLFK